MDYSVRRASVPDFNIDERQNDEQPRRCAAKDCNAEGVYPAPKSRDALRDYIWFCLDHVRAYNKSWNYYDGLQGAALEAEIRRFSKNFIGFTKIQLIAGNLYIIISCISFCILTTNSYIKRNELKRKIYFSINLPLFIFLPFSFYFILKNFYHIVKLLFFIRNF